MREPPGAVGDAPLAPAGPAVAVIPERVAWAGAAIGCAVGAFGVWELGRFGLASNEGLGFSLLIVLAMALAAASYRVLPSFGLGLVWFACGIQVLSGLSVALVQLATVLVAYGAARHGRPATVWASGLSIPVGAAIGLFYVQYRGWEALTNLSGTWLPQLLPRSSPSMTSAFLLVLLLLSAPWALGLVLRLRGQFQLARDERERAEVDAARATEVAELRAEQARLARDVHDVVGHSLTVILAQADSVEFMPDDDIGRIRAALTNISASARRSLGDVRQVLSATNDPTDATTLPAGGLDALVDGVRSAGNDVRSRVVGTARPLAPELDVVAFRVLQEMLTNALKHGRRAAPIEVTRSWQADDLRIEVRNFVAPTTGAAWADGLGEAGMRRRLESVRGRLELRQEETPEGRVFVANAWVPLRPRAELG